MDPFVGEIRMFAGTFAPTGWALCNGQLLPIAQNTALFSLLGVNYGGDGRSTFGLPNLQARMPLHAGAGPGLTPRLLGELGGQSAVALSENQLPAHSHGISVTGPSSQGTASSVVMLAPVSTGASIYRQSANTTLMDPVTLSFTGGGQAHNNQQPYLVVNFIIALQGIFPARG